MSSATATKKSTKVTKTAASKKAPARDLPSYKELVTEAIIDAKSRDGISRLAIKKFVEDKYKIDVTAAVNTHINGAIARGAEKGDFVLPKGYVVLDLVYITQLTRYSVGPLARLSLRPSPRLPRRCVCWLFGWTLLLTFRSLFRTLLRSRPRLVLGPPRPRSRLPRPRL